MQEHYYQKITDFFDSRTTYDAERPSLAFEVSSKEADSERGHPENAKRLLDFVPVQPDRTILDFATGTGLVAIPVAKTFAQRGSVIGIDISTGILVQGKAKILN